MPPKTKASSDRTTTSSNLTGRLARGNPIPHEYRDPDIDENTESEGHASSQPSSSSQASEADNRQKDDTNELERPQHQTASNIIASEGTSSDQQCSSIAQQPQPQSTIQTQSQSQTQSGADSPSQPQQTASQHQAGSTSQQTTSQPSNTSASNILSPANSSLVRSYRERQLLGQLPQPPPPAPQRPSTRRCTNCIVDRVACDGHQPCGRCERQHEWETSAGSPCRYE